MARILGSILSISKKLIYGLFYGRDDKVRKHALLVLFCGGLVGVLVDLDHIIAPISHTMRPLHIPYFICFWIVGLSYCAYLFRRIHNTMLKEAKNDRLEES